jgi:hypothetical protein
MKPFLVPSRVTVVAGLALLGMLPAQGSAHAAAAEPLLRPTPLVLKDGRIANVSIHVLPFAPGQAELAAEPAEYLAKLTRAVGTDCFLTAQVIGHIASSEVAEDDTLKAHRLARSRADAVQASLIGGGLPAKAIASVWDWQFMVREPRATLWVFELTAGEDCEGRQLQGDLVAQVPPSTEQSSAAPERATTAAAAPAEAPATKPAVAATKPAKKQAAAAAKPAVAARADAAPEVAQPKAAYLLQPGEGGWTPARSVCADGKHNLWLDPNATVSTLPKSKRDIAVYRPPNNNQWTIDVTDSEFPITDLWEIERCGVGMLGPVIQMDLSPDTRGAE